MNVKLCGAPSLQADVAGFIFQVEEVLSDFDKELNVDLLESIYLVIDEWYKI